MQVGKRFGIGEVVSQLFGNGDLMMVKFAVIERLCQTGRSTVRELNNAGGAGIIEFFNDHEFSLKIEE